MHLTVTLSSITRDNVTREIDLITSTQSQFIRSRFSCSSCNNSIWTVTPPGTPPATKRGSCGRLIAETLVAHTNRIMKECDLADRYSEYTSNVDHFVNDNLPHWGTNTNTLPQFN